MPRLPEIALEGAPDLARAPAAAFGGGEGLLEAAKVTREAAGHLGDIFQAEQGGRVAGGIARGSVEMEAARLAVEQSGDYEGWEEKFEEERKGIVERNSRGIQGDFRIDYDLRSHAIGEKHRLAVRERVLAKRLDVSRGGRLEAWASMYAQAQTAESPALRDQLLDDIEADQDIAAKEGVFDAEEVARIRIGHEAQLTETAREVSSQRIAAAIVAMEPDHAKRLERVRSELADQPELLDRVVARVKDINQEQRFAEDEAREKRMDELVNRAYEGKLKRAEFAGLGLEARERATLESILDHLDTKGGKQPPAVTTDLKLYYSLRGRLTSPDPDVREKARREDLFQYAPRLNQTEFKELAKLQHEDELVIDTFDEKVLNAIEIIGATPVGKKGPAREKAALREQAFRRGVDAERRKREAKEGRLLTSEEQNALIDKATEGVVVDEGFFTDTKRPRFSTLPEDIGDIPDSERAFTIRALRERGEVDPTPDRIAEAYLELLRSGIEFSETEP